jgi:hypothetical protein
MFENLMARRMDERMTILANIEKLMTSRKLELVEAAETT